VQSRGDISFILTYSAGGADTKVAALEKAGVIVTDSPAKIGSVMLKVGFASAFFKMSRVTRLSRP